MNQEDAVIAWNVLAESTEDFVGLWTIPWFIRQALPQTSMELRRARTFGIVRALLEPGYVVVGVPTNAGDFVAWELPAEVALERIEAAWKELPGDPDIGDVCWMTATSAGRECVAAGRETFLARIAARALREPRKRPEDE